MDEIEKAKNADVDSGLASKARGEFRAIGSEVLGEEASVTKDFFAEFMRRQYGTPRSHYLAGGKGRILEWARRFKYGDVFQMSDGEHRHTLLKVMIGGKHHTLGDATASMLDYKDVEKLCESLKESV